ncbi:MAG: hypothetical protein AB9907_13810 [Flexilinea sp.]
MRKVDITNIVITGSKDYVFNGFDKMNIILIIVILIIVWLIFDRTDQQGDLLFTWILAIVIGLAVLYGIWVGILHNSVNLSFLRFIPDFKLDGGITQYVKIGIWIILGLILSNLINPKINKIIRFLLGLALSYLVTFYLGNALYKIIIK